MTSSTPMRLAPLKTAANDEDTRSMAPTTRAAHHSKGKFMTDLCGQAPHTVRKRSPHSQASTLTSRSETPMPETLVAAQYVPHALDVHIDATTGLFVLAEVTEPTRHLADGPEGELGFVSRSRELAREEGTRVLSQDITVHVCDNGDGRFEIDARLGVTTYDEAGAFLDDDFTNLELAPTAAWFESAEAAFTAATELARSHSFGATVCV